MIRNTRSLGLLVAAMAMMSGAPRLAAQTPANDPSARLKEVLPADVAERVLAKIEDARARQLPAQALENRALKFAAKGVAPADVERSVEEQADRMVSAKELIDGARTKPASGDEIEAGAEALRQGVDASAVTGLAKTAPSGRSLAVPLFVIGSMVDRGLPSDQALAKVQEELQARATDVQLEQLPAQALAGQSNRPSETGRDLAASKRAGGRPAGVPANGGAGVRPTVGHRPAVAGRP